eukprot:TRINITY_DN935_c0_g1_i1.p1 TRINITY_DN935_c0_g1~~TRINITY_DN935_c0_g1_i1.p1  ORF type:complete len:108 (+),score=27.04 TRINITY_DN935_c0_g1_i1:286-609(+)
MRFLVLFAVIAMASASTVSKNQMIQKDLKCDICKTLVGKLNDEVLTQGNADQAIAKLEEICGKALELSPFLGETCTKFVEEVAKPNIEEILANKPEPEAACKKLKLC